MAAQLVGRCHAAAVAAGALVGLDRFDLFCAILFGHLAAPVLGLMLFILAPASRIFILFAIAGVLAAQVTMRCCVLALLEWRLVPEALYITWQGARTVCSVPDHTARWQIMCASTAATLVGMCILARVLAR